MEKYIDSDGQILDVYIDKKTKLYYNSNSKLHRLDGPAVEHSNGSYRWLKNNKYYRIGGPAYYESYDNKYNWYINDKQVKIYYICG